MHPAAISATGDDAYMTGSSASDTVLSVKKARPL
jgi:hypothetical protein